MYLKGNARRGPTFREALLMHAVSRLVFHGLIENIQASWVKMGKAGVAACANAGVNDLGGSLMNESITRAAGSEHGQEWSPVNMEDNIRALARQPRMRTTLYGDVSAERHRTAFNAAPLIAVRAASAGKLQRSKRLGSGREGATIESIAIDLMKMPPDSSLYERVVLMAACN